MDESERRALGSKRRRQVLGDAHVDRSEATKNDFNAEFVDFITRYAWGEIWTRPGIEPFTRSCMVLSTTIALGRWEEFRLHVKAAFNNGLTIDHIKEVIMQSAIYAGVPAANTAFAEAKDVLKELGKL